jgi:hypothetical protein
MALIIRCNQSKGKILQVEFGSSFLEQRPRW